MGKDQKVALLAIGVNLVLFGLKYLFAELSGSMALKAEAIHSLSDVIASSTVFTGLIIAKRKTSAFPYGLYKVENLVSVIVALAIFYAGYEIAGQAVKGSATELQNIWISIAGMVCAMAITYGFSRYEARVGNEINSPSLVADARHIHKPILGSFMGLVDVSEGINYLQKHGIPNYVFPEAAARTMASMVRFSDRLQSKENNKREIRRFRADEKRAAEIIKKKLDDSEKYFMPENEANEILQCYGFPLLKSRIVRDAAEIEAAVSETGLPVAMKIISADIVHKSDVGGVRIKIKSVEQAKSTFKEIIENARQYNPAARVDGVLIEEMARDGIEVILGAARDPIFGPLCMFGLGGIFVEALKDVTFRLAPMWELSAENMIRSIKAYKVLKGLRGKPPSDIEAIKDCILRLSQLVSDHPEISELDINPLIIYPEGRGCRVADSRIILVRQ